MENSDDLTVKMYEFLERNSDIDLWTDSRGTTVSIFFFKMTGGAEPKAWGVILIDTWRIQGGRAHIVTDSDFC